MGKRPLYIFAELFLLPLIAGCLASVICNQYHRRLKRPHLILSIVCTVTAAAVVVALISTRVPAWAWWDQAPDLIGFLFPAVGFGLVTAIEIVTVWQERHDHRFGLKRSHHHRASWRRRRWLHLIGSALVVIISTT